MTLQNETAGFSDNGTANGTANGTTPPVEAEVEGTGTLEQQTPVADGLATTSPEDSNAQQPTIETLQAQLKKLENEYGDISRYSPSVNTPPKHAGSRSIYGRLTKG